MSVVGVLVGLKNYLHSEEGINSDIIRLQCTKKDGDAEEEM